MALGLGNGVRASFLALVLLPSFPTKVLALDRRVAVPPRQHQELTHSNEAWHDLGPSMGGDFAGQGGAWYVRANGGLYGREDGQDWDNAFDGFPAAAHPFWDMVQPGDTIYLAGGIYSTPWRIEASGVAGRPLTFLRATGFDHGTETGWSPDLDAQVILRDANLVIGAFDHITVDGATQAGIKIEVRGNYKGIDLSPDYAPSSYITLRHFEVEGPGVNLGPAYLGARGVQSFTRTLHSNLTLEDCHIHDFPSVLVKLGNSRDFLMQRCRLHDTEDIQNHEDWIIDQGSNGTIRWNVMYDSEAQGIYLSSFSGPSVGPWYIYGNLLFQTRFPQSGCAVCGKGGLGAINVHFYNNTVYNMGNVLKEVTGGELINNLFYDNYAVNYGSLLTKNNLIASQDPFHDLANLDFRLGSGSPAIDQGIPLGSPYDMDILGIARPQGSGWDLGAYEHEEGPPAATFEDVPASHWAYAYIEALFQGGFVVGCQTSPRRYCAESGMTRGEAAVLVERGLNGGGYLPPEPSLATFFDTPLSEWSAKWVEALWKDGYTAGCLLNPLSFCPLRVHTRAESTVFFGRMAHGKDFLPPEPSEPPYTDVALGAWSAKWVAAAKQDGLTEPCEAPEERGDGRFRPEAQLTRAEAACMMAKAKQMGPP